MDKLPLSIRRRVFNYVLDDGIPSAMQLLTLGKAISDGTLACLYRRRESFNVRLDRLVDVSHVISGSHPPKH